MKKATYEKWALVVLGIVAAVLLVRLFWFSGVAAPIARATGESPQPTQVPESQAKAAAQRVQTSRSLPPKTVDELAKLDPILHVDLLKELDSRPLPKFAKSPFEFEAPPPPKPQPKAAPVEPPPPPPPPPIPLKAMGYAETPKGKEVYLTDDSSNETYVVHEGEEFGKRFKCTKITATQVEVQDETYHQTAQILIPQ